VSAREDTSSKGLPILTEATVIKTRLGPLLGAVGVLLSGAVCATMIYMDLQSVKRDVQEIKQMLTSRGYKTDGGPIGLLP
jgi:hypothetical protein